MGEWVTEEFTVQHAKESGLKTLSSRWVHVQKNEELVRSRLVVCNYRSTGLSFLRENHYFPTSNLMSLRVVLSLVQWFSWWIFTLDISTAFLFAELKKTERQVIIMPSSCIDGQSRRNFLFLKKALYGLRKAPPAWFRQIIGYLLELGGMKTCEVTVVRFEDPQYQEQCLVLVYVNDLLVVGNFRLCRWVIDNLAQKFAVKELGKIPANEKGRVEYLGREIMRKRNNDYLSIGMARTYFNSVEAALGMELKPIGSPPRLEKYAKINPEEDQELSKKETKIFRSALGKLAWFLLTIPVIQFQVSFVSSYQQKPT